MRTGRATEGGDRQGFACGDAADHMAVDARDRRDTAGHSGAYGASALPARNLALRTLRLGAAHRARNAVDEKVDRRRRSCAAGPLTGAFGTSPLISTVTTHPSQGRICPLCPVPAYLHSCSESS